MTRSEIQNKLKELGFKNMCFDDKTLVAYNQLQGFLYANHTPMKAITNLYLDGSTLRVIIYNDIDLDSGYEKEE